MMHRRGALIGATAIRGRHVIRRVAPAVTATYDGEITTFSAVLDEYDFDDDGTPEIVLSPEEKTALESGPIYDDTDPPTLTGAGDTATIHPSRRWLFNGGPGDFTFTWELLHGGEVLVSGSDFDDVEYDHSALPGETTLELRIEASDLNGDAEFTAEYTTPQKEVWSISDNGDETFSVLNAPSPEPALTITDNGDGTFNVSA